MRMLMLLAALLVPAGARAAPPVDLALAVVADVSRSIDDGEFRLQKEGYDRAFNDQRVVAAIRGGVIGAIAVTYIEFAGADQVRTVVDWTVIRDAASAHAFAAAIAAAPRSAVGRTAIGAGIDHAMQAFAESGFDAGRRVIDVSGDGTSNSGRDVIDARDDALGAGVTINGLAIINDHPRSWTWAHVQPSGGLPNYYRQHVTGGPGSFVIEVHDFRSFGDALTRKLVSEIAALAIRRPG